MSELPIKVTLKQGTGYDAPWITVDGADPNEVNTRLRALMEAGVLETVAEVAGTFRATALANSAPPQNSVAPVQQAGPTQQGGWGGQQNQQQAPAPQQQYNGGGAKLHPEGHQCDACGTVLQFKEVTRKSDQKTFKFWACPNQRNRDDGHTSKFAN